MPPLILGAAAAHETRAAGVLDGAAVVDPDLPADPPGFDPGSGDEPVLVGPVDPVGPVTAPRGLAEAIRTIDAISAELAANHAQMALLTGNLADREKRLAKAIREVSKTKASRVYRAAVRVSEPLRAVRKALKRSRKR